MLLLRQLQRVWLIEFKMKYKCIMYDLRRGHNCNYLIRTIACWLYSWKVTCLVMPFKTRQFTHKLPKFNENWDILDKRLIFIESFVIRNNPLLGMSLRFLLPHFSVSCVPHPNVSSIPFTIPSTHEAYGRSSFVWSNLGYNSVKALLPWPSYLRVYTYVLPNSIWGVLPGPRRRILSSDGVFRCYTLVLLCKVICLAFCFSHHQTVPNSDLAHYKVTLFNLNRVIKDTRNVLKSKSCGSCLFQNAEDWARKSKNKNSTQAVPTLTVLKRLTNKKTLSLNITILCHLCSKTDDYILN